jgi:hypothetical protein
VDVLHGDRRLVHEDAHGQRHAAERHEVDVLPGDPQGERGGEQRQRDVDDHDEGAAPVAQEKQHHQAGEDRAQAAFLEQVVDRAVDHRRLVELVAHLEPLGEQLLELGDVLLHQVHHLERRGVATLGDGQVDRAASVRQCIRRDDIRRVLDRGDVAHEHGAGRPALEGHRLEILDVRDNGVGRDDGILVVQVHVARRADDVAPRERLHDVVGRQAVGLHAVGVDVDRDGARAAAEGRRGRDAGQRGEGGPDAVERLVLHLIERDVRVVGREDEIADGDAAGVEAHDERRDRARRHEGARAVHLGDRLGHGLRHVRARVELELHDRGALDGLRLDVFDAGNVEEMVFVTVGEVALHLGGIHAAVGLGDVDGGDAQRREDVARHPLQREIRPEGHRDDQHEDGQRTPQGQL